MKFITRRGFGRVFGAGALLTMFRSRSHATRLNWQAGPDSRSVLERRYRADAQVVLFSVPVFRRSGIGGGSATWSEAAGTRMLEFIGYSLPEKAAGLHRLGFVRELARTGENDFESIYFGVMTASPEESAADARKALREGSQNLLYTTIEGRVAPGDVETTTAHFMGPAQMSGRYDELFGMARQALSSAPGKPPEFDPRTTSATTFLHAIAGLLQDSTREQTPYIYNGRLYRLWLRKSADPKAAAYFRQKGLLATDTRVIRAEGKLRREFGGKETNFAVWVAEADARPIPLRIEYQAKPFLRLTFEAE
jgi:hypothetical protein